jgi:lycopene beta-cyclase
MAGPDLDVVVVGDGPAGLALAAACCRAGLGVVVCGRGEPWRATYGTWRDDVDVPDGCFSHIAQRVVVHGHRRHVVERAYGVFDNDALRAHLSGGLDVRVAEGLSARHHEWGSRLLVDGGELDARLVVEATGFPPMLGRAPPPAAHQTAYGVVVGERPDDRDGDDVVLMDLRPMPGSTTPTFCYVVPVAGGWLVEETALAARPAVAPDRLRELLGVRAGTGVLAPATGHEVVSIPVGGRLPDRRQPVVAFGAAAKLTHPATGYSVAASLRAAPRIAAAIAGGADAARVWEAVWPATLRRSRRLHDYGLEVLLGLRPYELATFFDAFFDLPVDVWAPYLRVDSPPAAVVKTMSAVLQALPWSMRRRLLVNPFGGR